MILDRPIPLPVPGGTFSWRIVGTLGDASDFIVDQGTVIAENYEHTAVSDGRLLYGVREPAPSRAGWAL
jgi:hypothetical protein